MFMLLQLLKLLKCEAFNSVSVNKLFAWKHKLRKISGLFGSFGLSQNEPIAILRVVVVIAVIVVLALAHWHHCHLCRAIMARVKLKTFIFSTSISCYSSVMHINYLGTILHYFNMAAIFVIFSIVITLL